jgi:hypothetical protein
MAIAVKKHAFSAICIRRLIDLVLGYVPIHSLYHEFESLTPSTYHVRYRIFFQEWRITAFSLILGKWTGHDSYPQCICFYDDPYLTRMITYFGSRAYWECDQEEDYGYNSLLDAERWMFVCRLCKYWFICLHIENLKNTRIRKCSHLATDNQSTSNNLA